MSSRPIGAVALAMALLFTSCSGDETTLDASAVPEAAASSGPPTDEGGFGPPSQQVDEFPTVATPYEVTGEVTVADDGCWYVRTNQVRRLIVMPAGWELAGTAMALVDPTGQRIGDGDEIDGSVRFVHREELPAGGKWVNYMDFCQPDVGELAVFETISISYDPSVLTVEDHRAMVSEAVFTEDWPCGRGWAASTADQRVGLVIHQIDDAQTPPSGRLDLPAPGWNAEIIVGKHLFVDWCNDAIEEWMPTPQIVARYPLEATIRLDDPAPLNSDPPAVVRATLTDGSVVVADAVISLAEIELRNEAYNAFAG